MAFLLGRWSLRREINDGEGAFVGDALFTADGTSGLRWRETGRLALGGYVGEAHRTLLIGPGPRSGTWEVRFDDGRPFHPLDLRSGRWEAEHQCGPDLYRGVYATPGADRLTVRWRVTGPGRADTIVSDYRRALPA
jgi:hypothetical protein